MPSEPLSLRLPPVVYDQLCALAERRDRPRATVAAELLTDALADPGTGRRRPTDGALVESVRQALGDVSTPDGRLHRETAVHLARTIERDRGPVVAAVQELHQAISRARRAENPQPDPWEELAGLLISPRPSPVRSDALYERLLGDPESQALLASTGDDQDDDQDDDDRGAAR